MLAAVPAMLLALVQGPVLHQRPAPAPAEAPTQAAAKRSSLPPDADGEYQFGETGEVIELYVEDHTLRGYLVKRSEHGRAESTPLTFDFTSAAAVNNTVSFTTRTLHGESYSFSGSLVRGPATNPATLGYYLLRGRLTLHTGAVSTPGTVTLKRLGQH